MNVLYIVTAFPRDESDVITPWMVETIQRLRARGITVDVLAPSYRGMKSGTVHGTTVHRFRYAPSAIETLTHDQTAPDRIREKPWYASLVPGYVAAGSAAAARLARTGRYSAIHAFWPIPHGVLGVAAKKASGVPLVSTFFGVELTWLERDLAPLRPVLQWIVRKSDAVTAISTYTANALRKSASVHMVPDVIPFGAAAKPVGQLASRPSDRGPFEVLFVGRLVERKGVHVLLEAIARLRGSRAVTLRVVGDGPARAGLEARAATLGVADMVTFEGGIPGELLNRRFGECDLFVLPAVVDSKGDTEGLGVVLIEAMQNERPVIASSVGGIPDIVRDGETGLLVPANDADALASAIQRVIDNPADAARLAVRGRRYVEDVFSWDTIIDRLEAVYQRVARADRR